MNPSLHEIENCLFEKLKNLNCVPIKNVIAIEPNIFLKNIILDQSYLQEKLNLFIWMLFKVEPTFASDFVDSEYFSSEEKCKKIIDCLTCLGFVDPVDFNKSKLLNTSTKNFKEVLLILDDLGKFLPKRSVTTLDDFTFDFSMTSSFLPSVPSAKSEENDEAFERKMQIFDDANFFTEYRSIVQPGSSSSLIPSDLSRVIKNINANSTYFESIQASKMTRSDLVPSLEECLEKVQKEIEHNQSILKSSNDSNFNLVQLEENSDEFAQRNAKLERYLEEIGSYLNNFREMSKSVLDGEDSQAEHEANWNEFKPESKLEQNFEKFYSLIEDYKKANCFPEILIIYTENKLFGNQLRNCCTIYPRAVKNID
ncbi:hypothetical protein BpHYR1_004296 [Brachionus plicatilis]|uniref:Uncharacterized protein n=1 Tax=Brachionus plicatilis TaxID=10195 RepID=A0A3M7Q740_BRAPC|nr:hypothetical protein BpHYR1_004296 [Brachionus plicatilis]